jgi:hypothetical protein
MVFAALAFIFMTFTMSSRAVLGDKREPIKVALCCDDFEELVVQDVANNIPGKVNNAHEVECRVHWSNKLYLDNGEYCASPTGARFPYLYVTTNDGIHVLLMGCEVLDAHILVIIFECSRKDGQISSLCSALQSLLTQRRGDLLNLRKDTKLILAVRDYGVSFSDSATIPDEAILLLKEFGKEYDSYVLDRFLPNSYGYVELGNRVSEISKDLLENSVVSVVPAASVTSETSSHSAVYGSSSSSDSTAGKSSLNFFQKILLRIKEFFGTLRKPLGKGLSF